MKLRIILFDDISYQNQYVDKVDYKNIHIWINTRHILKIYEENGMIYNFENSPLITKPYDDKLVYYSTSSEVINIRKNLKILILFRTLLHIFNYFDKHNQNNPQFLINHITLETLEHIVLKQGFKYTDGTGKFYKL